MTADALYQAILAAPDDDLPRLVYADWLDDRGRADTAAFIRIQVELARVPAWHPLAVRSRFRPNWWLTGRGKHPPTAATPRGFRWEADKFRRGFPCRVRVSNAAVAARHADALFAAAPVAELSVENADRDSAPLLSHPRVANVRRLHLGGGTLLTLAHLRPLIDSPHARGLTDLSFTYRVEPDNVLRAVLRSPLAAGVRRLNCHGYDYPSPADQLAVYEGASLPRLTEFDFRRARAVADVRRVLDSAHLPRLERLNLYEVPVRAEGIGQLNAWAGCGRVTRLDMQFARLNGVAVRTLADGNWASLRELNLEYNTFGPRAVQALAAAGWMPGLRLLNLGSVGIGDNAVKALAESPAAGGLLGLRLGFNNLTDAAAKAILDSPHLGGLLHLDLSMNPGLGVPMGTALRKRFGASVVEV